MTITVDSNGVATREPNKDVLREWADELESGKYDQGKGALNENGKFCCLGVLCEMAVAKGVIPAGVEVLNEDYETGEEIPSGTFSYLGSEAFPPAVVAEWAFGDPDEHNPQLKSGDGYNAASFLNDDFGATFEEIATAIRETFEL